jgi:hypothetical protein
VGCHASSAGDDDRCEDPVDARGSSYEELNEWDSEFPRSGGLRIRTTSCPERPAPDIAGSATGAGPPKATLTLIRGNLVSSPASLRFCAALLPPHHGICTMVGRNLLAGLSLALLSVQQTAALGQKQCITFPQEKHHPRHVDSPAEQTVFTAHPSNDNLLIASTEANFALPLLLDSTDDDAIHLAAASFARDVEKVTGVRPHLYNNTLPHGTKRCIMVGTVSSGLVGGMGLEHVEEMKGKWEAFDVRVVDKARNLEEALVIAGSDRVSRPGPDDGQLAYIVARDYIRSI